MNWTCLELSGALSALFVALLATSGAAYGFDYVSVRDSHAIIYDANSSKAKKLFVISRYTPLEKVVDLKNWIKVRDSYGSLGWIERISVSDTRYVVVTVPYATVRQAPDMKSPVLFQVAKNVAMESLGINGGGWIKARHQDGSTGYMRSVEVWGAD